MPLLESFPGPFIEAVAVVAEVVGVLIVLASAVRAGWLYLVSFLRNRGNPGNMLDIRFALGRGLVLSLEFFIAADIVRTILAPSLMEVALLAAIIAVRTALAFSLEYELRQATRTRGPADDAG